MATDAKPRTVFICIDNSSYSEQILEFYKKNFHCSTDKIVLGFVPELYNYDWASPTVVGQLLNEEAQKVNILEEKYKGIMTRLGLSAKFETGEGKKVGEVLCKMAEKEHADIICVGTRGLGKVRRTILGSVSSYIVHHAHVPTLVCNWHKEATQTTS